MDKTVYFIFGNQELKVVVPDVPEDATNHEIRDMAFDIFLLNSFYEIEEA